MPLIEIKTEYFLQYYLFYFTDDKCLIFKKTLFTLRRINRIEKETGVTTKICWLTVVLDFSGG